MAELTESVSPVRDRLRGLFTLSLDPVISKPTEARKPARINGLLALRKVGPPSVFSVARGG
jgi:hypothetical protein